MQHERALFQAFVVPAKRRRYIDLLETGKGREKIRLALDHFQDLYPRYCHKIEPAEQNATAILSVLKLCLSQISNCLR